MRIFGIGNEIVECLRIAQMIERHGEDFLRRVFTQREILHCSSQKRATQHYAARWAGKQAVIRALAMTAHRGQKWRDLEITTPSGGNVTVRLAGAYRAACQENQIGQLLVTIAHCRTHASAAAIAVMQDD